MELSTGAKEIRALAERLAQISERSSDEKDTSDSEHQIDTTELMRLKVALRPLVSDELQGRFMMVLNKLASEQPITFSDSRLLTTAFASMADIIASDTTLIQRLRSDIRDFNMSTDDEEEAQEEEEDIAADIRTNWGDPVRR